MNDTYINNKKKNTSNSVFPDSLGESEPESRYSLEITKRGKKGKVEDKHLIGEEEKKEDNGISQRRIVVGLID